MSRHSARQSLQRITTESLQKKQSRKKGKKDHSNLGRKHASAANLLDLLLRALGEEACLHNNGGLGEVASAENLEDTVLGDVNDGGVLARLVSLGALEDLSGDKVPQALDADGGAVIDVLLEVVVAHTNLTEVARVEFVKEGTVVVLATSVTATTGVRAVLADTTMTSGDVAALLAVLAEPGRHFEKPLSLPRDCAFIQYL
mmetsp:Transcript_26718/g.42833  ORF Transcript_26718/g.42833 Transcript_26718/m.42833 type:complete len:201 (-) Transcript_26718:619-1221(-)